MLSEVFRISEFDFACAGGHIQYGHNGELSDSGAFDIGESAKILVKIPRQMAARSVQMLIYNESLDACLSDSFLKLFGFDTVFDLYELNIPKLEKGLYFYSLRIETYYGTFYAVKNDCGIYFDHTEHCDFQISVSDFAYSEPNIYGGVIYHIFVDRFAKGKKRNIKSDSVRVADWDAEIPEYPTYPGAPLKNNYFYGGDLYGISDKLDYLKSLGVSVIYLSPIFESPSNHKYDTSDYMRVDEGFGGDKALENLIQKARKVGISVILDAVFNHTGADSIYFNKFNSYSSLGAYQSESSPYYSWFDFKDHPNDYTCWWGISILPRINPDKTECGNYFVGKGGVVEKYAEMGISGLRLDVADELSDSFISSVKKKLEEKRCPSILYGEVWEDASNKIAYGKRKRYYLGNELDGVMNYPLRTGIIDYLRNKRTDGLKYALTEVINNAPTRIRNMQMNLLGSHDTLRIITALAGEDPGGKSNAYLSKKRLSQNEYQKGVKLLKMAYTVIATLPGIPSVYYGDEVGVQGYSDPFNRLTYPWGREDKNILSHYRRMGEIRTEHEVYKKGIYKLLYLDCDILCFVRIDGDNRYFTVLNNSERNLIVKLPMAVPGLISRCKTSVFNLLPFTSEIIMANNTVNICIFKNERNC